MILLLLDNSRHRLPLPPPPMAVDLGWHRYQQQREQRRCSIDPSDPFFFVG